jgi:pyrrolidone-carboxylate peptidase
LPLKREKVGWLLRDDAFSPIGAAKKSHAAIDLWVAFGEGSRVVRYETTARNILGPDLQGQLPPQSFIEAGGTDRSIDLTDRYFKSFIDSLKDSGITESNDAGSYTCNELFYRLLGKKQQNSDTLKNVLFIHVRKQRGHSPEDKKQIEADAEPIAQAIFDYLSKSLE